MLLQVGEPAIAEELLITAVRRREEAFGSSTWPVASSLGLLAAAQAAQDSVTAETTFEKALQVASSNLKSAEADMSEFGSICAAAGLHCAKRGSPSQALRLFHRARDTYARWCGDDQEGSYQGQEHPGVRSRLI